MEEPANTSVKNFFPNCVIDRWNSLSSNVPSNIASFGKRLNKLPSGLFPVRSHFTNTMSVMRQLIAKKRCSVKSPRRLTHLGYAQRRFSQQWENAEDDVRTQWKNLKDTFKRKLKKRQADVDAGVEDAEPTWRFWSKMLFIRHECHHDAPSASINASVNTENSFPEMAAVDTPPHSLESLLSLVEKQISDESSNSVDGNGASTELGNASTSLPQNSFACEGTEINSNHSIHSPEETDGVASHSPVHHSATALTRLRRKALKRKALEVDAATLMCSMHPKTDFEDEYTWFGRSVASSLRRLSDSAPIVSLTLKKQISDLIYEAELKQLMRSQKVEEA